MALKLGELLLNEKMVTSGQLEEALKNQVVYGIRLGSSLVEIGYVDEDALAQLLSRKLGVPCVGRKELASVSKELLRDFPHSLVEAHHVVPLRLEGNRLSLAMTDPTDFNAIEEIGFVTGHVVVPYIAPDVEISWAMAKYYRLSSGQVRYQMVAEQHRKSGAAEPAKPAAITIPAFTESGERLNGTGPAEVEGFAQLRGREVHDFSRVPAWVRRYAVGVLPLDFARP